MIRIRDLAVPLTETASLEDLAAKRLMLPPQQIAGVVIVRKAVDARRYRGAPIQFVYILDVRLEPKLEKKVLQKLRRDRNVEAAPEPEAAAPLPKLHLERRPVVVGFGPAGMFAALTLARQGCEPLVLERGHDVDATRTSSASGAAARSTRSRTCSSARAARGRSPMASSRRASTTRT